jgi:hypothetical protein
MHCHILSLSPLYPGDISDFDRNRHSFSLLEAASPVLRAIFMANCQCRRYKGKFQVLTLPPNEALSQLQFCRANIRIKRSAIAMR